MATSKIGAHVGQANPLAEAAAREADIAQFFLGDPQGWQSPSVPYDDGPAALRRDAAADGVDLYVHAPYRLNVATTNNRIRIPSRKLLQEYVDAAAEIGAKALIVHGGHVLKSDDPDIGFCLDTCHAHAGGIELADVVSDVLAVTGRIDLVHANDSRDGFDSGADRHANLGAGTIGIATIAAIVTAAGTPAIVETPGAVEGQAADIAALRKEIG